MKKYTGKHFSGSSEKSEGGDSFLQAKTGRVQPAPDPMDPYRPPHSGLIPLRVAGDVDARTFHVYIPESFPTSGPGVFLFCGENTSAAAVLNAGWREAADCTGTLLVLLEAEKGGWDAENLDAEIEYAFGAYRRGNLRDVYNINESNYYVVGLGTGGIPALAFALLYSNIFAGFASELTETVDPALLETVGSLPSVGDDSILRREVPITAWVGGEHTESLRGYLAGCIHASEQTTIWQDGTECLLQRLRPREKRTGSHALAQVRISSKLPDANVLLPYLLRVKRWYDDGNGYFSLNQSTEEMGLRRYEAVVDGKLRHWLVSEPSALRRHPERKLPVVLALHGYTCTGEIFARNSGWHEVGEEHDFIVVYATAYPGSYEGICAPLPMWNCADIQNAGVDDVSFLMQVLDDVARRYPVDLTRIYATGHSNGSAMCQELMLQAPERFAAFAPQAFMYGDATGKTAQFRDVPRPVWFIKGEFDVYSAGDLSENTANDRMLRALCREHQINFDTPDITYDGKYVTHVWRRADGAPVICFTVAEHYPHCYLPLYAHMTWTDFFVHFSVDLEGKTHFA